MTYDSSTPLPRPVLDHTSSDNTSSDGVLNFIRRVVRKMFEAKKNIWLDFGPAVQSVGWEVNLFRSENEWQTDDF